MPIEATLKEIGRILPRPFAPWPVVVPGRDRAGAGNRAFRMLHREYGWALSLFTRFLQSLFQTGTK